MNLSDDEKRVVTMVNMTHDEIINYGLNHKDPTVRELARRFQDYRDSVNRIASDLEERLGRVIRIASSDKSVS